MVNGENVILPVDLVAKLAIDIAKNGIIPQLRVLVAKEVSSHQFGSIMNINRVI